MNRILRTIVIFLAVVAAALLILVYGFRIRKVTVEGNQRCSSEQISRDLTGTNLLKNTLYFAWKYRSAVPSEDAPYLTSVKATILSPTSVKVTVTESTLIGRVLYDSKSVYFDDSGIVQLISDEIREGIPLVTGVDIEKPVLYQKLAVENAATLRTMLSVTQLLIQSDFIPDSVSFDASGNMTLRFGSIVVKLGQDEYLEEKIANLVQIYPQIESQSGTLNMEGFTGRNDSITFKKSGSSEEESETEQEDGSGQTLAGVGSDTQQEPSAAAGDGGDGSAGGDSAGENQAGDGTDGGTGQAGNGQEAAGDDAGEDAGAEGNPDSSNASSGVMAFDSNGTLHYDAHIVNGQVVDGSGNPIAGCSVDENGNIRDAYWNVIDPATGQPVQ